MLGVEQRMTGNGLWLAAGWKKTVGCTGTVVVVLVLCERLPPLCQVAHLRLSSTARNGVNAIQTAFGKSPTSVAGVDAIRWYWVRVGGCRAASRVGSPRTLPIQHPLHNPHTRRRLISREGVVRLRPNHRLLILRDPQNLEIRTFPVPLMTAHLLARVVPVEQGE